MVDLTDALAHHLPGLVVGHLLKVQKHQDLPVIVVQIAHGAVELPVALPLQKVQLRGLGDAALRRARPGKAAGAAQVLSRQVLADGEKPRPEAAPPRIARAGGGLGEGIEHQLLGVVHVADHAVQKQRQALAVFFQQRAQVALVPALQEAAVDRLVRFAHGRVLSFVRR